MNVIEKQGIEHICPNGLGTLLGSMTVLTCHYKHYNHFSAMSRSLFHPLSKLKHGFHFLLLSDG